MPGDGEAGEGDEADLEVDGRESQADTTVLGRRHRSRGQTGSNEVAFEVTLRSLWSQFQLCRTNVYALGDKTTAFEGLNTPRSTLETNERTSVPNGNRFYLKRKRPNDGDIPSIAAQMTFKTLFTKFTTRGCCCELHKLG